MNKWATVLLTALVGGCASTPPTDSPAPPTATDVQVADEAAVDTGGEPPASPDLSHKRITIAAVGDMMLGTDYPDNRLPDDDAEGFLAGVTPILVSADLTFGNLEGVLVDGGEAAKKCSNPGACYLFRSPTRYAKHLQTAGFDVISLANNHARDFGEEGRSSSMQALAALGIRHSGREGDFATLTVNGLKVAVLAYAVTKDSNMLLDYELALQTVRKYAAENDIVIVSFHGGGEGQNFTHVPFAEEEYFGEPRGDVVKFARMMIDGGADLVLGHGPHVVRGIENFEDRLIAYSLGNFATYYGISVDGIKGIAPILVVTLDGEGRFISGKIHSTIQHRPAGPTVDPQQRALKMIAELSNEDFGAHGVAFGEDGELRPVPRPSGLPGAITF